MNLKHLFFLAATGITAVACSEVDEALSVDSQKTLSAISSGSDRFATRLNNETGNWEKGDAVGVYMFDATDKNVLNQAVNVQYVAAGSGAKVNFAANPGIAIYDEPANFIAYYPYSADANNIDASAALYKVDLNDQSVGISSHDLMWAKATEKTTEDLLATGLALTFRHQLALLRVNIKNENVTNVESITVGGLNTTATFSLIDGALTNIASPKTITLYKAGAKSFIGVMLPTTELKKKMALTIQAGGKKFQYSVPDNSTITEFQAGYEYNFNITLTKSDGGELDGSEGGNEPWQPGGSEDGTGGEVSDNKDIPADYTQVAVGAATDLTNVLKDATGKIALVFADGEYMFNGHLTVPAEVKELLLISATKNQVKLNLKALDWVDGTLERLAFNNLEIVGDPATKLANKHYLATDATVEIKDCYFHNMQDVFSVDSDANHTIMKSLTVENSRIYGATLFYRYKTALIKIASSTLYNMAVIARGTIASIDIQNSTLLKTAGTALEGESSNFTLIYKNNVSGLIGHENLAYRVTPTEFSGNYATLGRDNEKTSINIHKGPIDGVTFPNAWLPTSIQKTASELFDDVNNLNFKLTIDDKVGDPRWYKTPVIK